MTALAYYNEHDAYAAQWIRNLIAAGLVAPGDVDERSIEDVHPDDLRPYTQCHFFAGVAVWSLALRRAGWPDNRPVWTGSCPCQPFSTAGEGLGFNDPRHLWPDFAWLIGQRKPPVVLGEQVASKAVDPWVDLVQADLEAMGYAFGAIPFPAAGVGAPNIRDRTFWASERLADTKGLRQPRVCRDKANEGQRGTTQRGNPGRLGNSYVNGSQGRQAGAQGEGAAAAIPGWDGRMADTDGCHQAGKCQPATRDDGTLGNGGSAARTPTASQADSFWSDADWLFCRDGRWRPVESGTFQLAHGDTSRVGRLRAYGNGLNAEAATQFIAAYMEAA